MPTCAGGGGGGGGSQHPTAVCSSLHEHVLSSNYEAIPIKTIRLASQHVEAEESEGWASDSSEASAVHRREPWASGTCPLQPK